MSSDTKPALVSTFFVLPITQKITSLFQSRPKVIFTVADIAEMLKVDRTTINYYLKQRPKLFPAGCGLDGRGCRREWLRDDALRVVQLLVNLSPVAARNLGALQTA